MRKLFAVLALLASATVASAQNPISPVLYRDVTPVSRYRSAADIEPALVIKYFPPVNTAATANTGATTVAVAATSLTFVVNGAAYTGFEAPVSGALGGVITMTDASADTLGEVVDIINSTPVTFPTGYFRAAIVAGLRSDVMSTLALVADAADTDVMTPGGEVIFWDTSVLDDEDLFFSNAYVPTDGTGNLAKFFFDARNVKQHPFDGISSVVNYLYEKFTNAGTFTTLTVYAVKENYVTGKGCVATATCGPNSGSSEVARVIYSSAAGATTVAGTLPAGLSLLAQDEKVFARVEISGADTSVWQYNIAGFQFGSRGN